MKFLIVLACALAAASAGHLVAPIVPVHGAQHLPVIGPNGVPIDTPAVQQATAEHLAHKVEAHARNGDYHVAPVVAAAPVASIAAYTAPHAYPTTLGVLPVTANGVPLETPEVAAAKSAHFAAHGEALARTAYPRGHYIAKRGVYTAPFAYTAPVYSYGAYGHHFLAKRGVYAAPLTYSHASISAYPYAHYY